jgi:hypothetical protein
VISSEEQCSQLSSKQQRRKPTSITVARPAQSTADQYQFPHYASGYPRFLTTKEGNTPTRPYYADSFQKQSRIENWNSKF